MIRTVGVPKEIKNHEYRVGLTPESARELAAHGHEVWVESGAGSGSKAAALWTFADEAPQRTAPQRARQQPQVDGVLA